MTGLDVEAVLRDHEIRWLVGGERPRAKCADPGCDWTVALLTGDAVEDAHRAHVATVLNEHIAEWLAPVQALADQWNDTPDYAPSTYDQGRVDQRHDMTTQLLEVLASLAATEGDRQ